jgi:hypothetical protein
LLLALALGIYLLQLWQPEHQVQLHSDHLLRALERKDWPGIASFVGSAFQDQWGDDRTLVQARLREVLSYTRRLKLETHDAVAFASADSGEWHARVTADGEENEVMAVIKQHINTLPEPFRLQWRRQSWKPWDWKLMRVTNPALEFPEGAGF